MHKILRIFKIKKFHDKILIVAFLLVCFTFLTNIANAASIKDDATGGDCGSIGIWDGNTKTCLLTADLSDSLIIEGNGITLDGANHQLIGNNIGVGIVIDNWNNIVVKNLKIKNFASGIYISNSENNFITNNIISDNSEIGVVLSNSHGNIIIENTISNNQISGMEIWYVVPMSDNKIYRNNFINNYQIYAMSDSGDFFYQNPPIGGNYWSDFDEPIEGCIDLNSNNFCDFSYVFDENGQDSYSWTKQDGWKIPANQPSAISNLGQYKSDEQTEISESGITTENAAVFKANIVDPDGDDVKLEIELRRTDELAGGFANTPTASSTYVASGTTSTIIVYGLSEGQYHWQARAMDSQGNTSDWQEFDTARNVDFEVKLVPLYTQVISPYPSEAATDEWDDKEYGNGGTGGFTEYQLNLTATDNYTLVVNGEDDDAPDGKTRATLEVRLATSSQEIKTNPILRKNIRWPSGDNQYKNLYLNLGSLSAGNYVLRLTSVADSVDTSDPDTNAKNLNVYLDWLKIKGSVAPEIHIEAEGPTGLIKLVGGFQTIQNNKNVVQIDGFSCGRAIADCGCYMVSAVMLLRYYDDGSLTNLRGEITPLTLNNWMKKNNGYDNGNVNPAKIAEYSGYKLAFDSQKSGDYLNNYARLNEYLDNNWPTIAKENASRGGKKRNHFLVIDNGLANFVYNVKDSAWYNTKNLSDTRSGDYIRNYEGGFDGLRLYQPSDGQPIKSITLSGHSPIEFLITDSLGRRLGKDPIIGIEYNEIPDATYYNDSIDNATDEFLAAGEESKFAHISNPIDGQYNVKIIGTAEGNYSINSLIYDDTGQSHSQIFFGTTQANLTTELNLNYTPSQSGNIVIEPIDQNPPEAKIYFDAIAKTLKIEGIDDLSETVVEKQNNIYTIQDAASNTLKLVFDELKQHGKEIKAELESLQYNKEPLIESEAEFKYERSLDKEGNIKELEQRIKVEDNFDIKAKYYHSKNETKIKIEREEEDEKVEYTLPDFVIIKLITKSSNLDFEF